MFMVELKFLLSYEGQEGHAMIVCLALVNIRQEPYSV